MSPSAYPANSILLNLVCLREAGWLDGGLFVVSVALATGMFQQARAISRCLRSRADMPADVLTAWRVAVVWRWGVVAVIAGYWTFEQLLAVRWIYLEEYPDDGTRFGLLLLCLMASLWATPWGIPRPASSPRWEKIAHVLLLGVTLAFLGWIVCELPAVHALVHRAIVGIVGNRLPRPTFEQKLEFVGFAGATLAVNLLGVGLLLIVAPRLRTGLFRNVFRGISVLCMTTTVAYIVWVRGWGLSGVSPCMAGDALQRPWQTWLGVGLLMSAGSAALAYRSCVSGQPCRPTGSLPWRSSPDNYWNEHPAVLILLGILCLGYLALDVAVNWRWPTSLSAVVELLALPKNAGLLGLAWLSARGLSGRRDRAGEDALQVATGVTLGVLFSRWLCLLVLVAGTVESLTWFGFGVSTLLR